MQQIVLLMTIGLLLAACGGLNQTTGNQTAPGTPALPPPHPSPVNATPSNATHPPVVTPPAPPKPVNVTPPSTPPANTLSDQQVWNLITNDNAEKECLALTKQSTGMYSSIKTCVCDETLGQGVKTYICTVSTTQTPIPVSIICKLADRSCGWVSGALSGTMTFEQISQSLGAQ